MYVVSQRKGSTAVTCRCLSSAASASMMMPSMASGLKRDGLPMTSYWLLMQEQNNVRLYPTPRAHLMFNADALTLPFLPQAALSPRLLQKTSRREEEAEEEVVNVKQKKAVKSKRKTKVLKADSTAEKTVEKEKELKVGKETEANVEKAVRPVIYAPVKTRHGVVQGTLSKETVDTLLRTLSPGAVVKFEGMLLDLKTKQMSFMSEHEFADRWNPLKSEYETVVNSLEELKRDANAKFYANNKEVYETQWRITIAKVDAIEDRMKNLIVEAGIRGLEGLSHQAFKNYCTVFAPSPDLHHDLTMCWLYRFGSLQSVFQFYWDFCEAGHTPTIGTSTVLLDIFASQYSLDEVKLLLSKFERYYRSQISGKIMSKILQVAINQGRLVEARRFLEVIAERKLILPADVLNNWVEQVAAVGDLEIQKDSAGFLKEFLAIVAECRVDLDIEWLLTSFLPRIQMLFGEEFYQEVADCVASNPAVISEMEHPHVLNSLIVVALKSNNLDLLSLATSRIVNLKTSYNYMLSPNFFSPSVISLLAANDQQKSFRVLIINHFNEKIGKLMPKSDFPRFVQKWIVSQGSQFDQVKKAQLFEQYVRATNSQALVQRWRQAGRMKHS
jgi:hypothetical protein